MGRLLLPRPPHHRRSHPSPAREARGRAQAPGADPDRARRGILLPGLMCLPPALRAHEARRWCSSRSSRPPSGSLYFIATPPARSRASSSANWTTSRRGAGRQESLRQRSRTATRGSSSTRSAGVSEATDARVTLLLDVLAGPRAASSRVRTRAWRRRRLREPLARAAPCARDTPAADRDAGRRAGSPRSPSRTSPWEGKRPAGWRSTARDLDDVAEAVTWSATGCSWRPAWRSRWRWSARSWSPRRCRGGCGGSSTPPTRSPRAASSTRCRSTPRTSSASSPARSTRCRRSCARLDVARKEFIATASHELRTPIFSLGGFVELLQDEELDEATRREFLDTMSEQVARLQKLVGRPARPVAAGRGLARARTTSRSTSSELARSVVDEFSPAPAEHRHRARACGCRTGGPRRSATLSGWPRSCASCSTTRCGTRRRAPRVSVGARAAATAPPGSTVADGGPGAARRSDTKVFERFYTGDAARGAGLGLAIARELAERMDGRLSVELAARRGTALHARAAGRTRTAREARRGGRAGPPLALAAAGAAAPAATTAAAAERRRRRRSPPRACRWSEGIGHKGGFDPARSTTGSAPGVVTILSIFAATARACARRRGRPGLRLRAGRRRLHRHQRARGHRASGADRGRERGVRRVLGRQPGGGATSSGYDPNADVALLNVDPAGLTLPRSGWGTPRPSTSASPWRRSAARSGSAQSLSGRRRLRRGPQHQSLDALQDRRRDPDGRRHQPGQLRRPAARRHGRGDRDQRPDQDRLRRRRGRGLRGPGRAVGARLPICAPTGAWTTPTWE